MRLSVVIPTWNEQLWLPRLLQSLMAAQNLAEIIVADNASQDATVSIAKAYGCKVVSREWLVIGGRRSRAVTLSSL
jgi:glycosyltransferase involved in cell wall biosynthesis